MSKDVRRRQGEPICMNQLYFLVDSEDELRDEVWNALFEKMSNSSITLSIEPLEVSGTDKKLFKVSWWSWLDSYININNQNAGSSWSRVEVTNTHVN